MNIYVASLAYGGGFQQMIYMQNSVQLFKDKKINNDK